MGAYWWQRGPLLTCGYWMAFPACLLDNLVHTQRKWRLLARRGTGWGWVFHGTISGGRVCEWHDRAVGREMERKWGADG